MLLFSGISLALWGQKDFSLGLSLPFPTGINNGYYLEPGGLANYSYGQPDMLKQFSYGNLDPGLSLSYKGFTLNFYWRYQYGGQATAEGGYPVQYAYRSRSYYYLVPSELHDPFIMERDDFMYFNLGYQWRWGSELAPDAPAALVGAYIGYNNLELASGLDLKYGRIMLYAQLVPVNGYDDQYLFQGEIQVQGGIRTQIKLL